MVNSENLIKSLNPLVRVNPYSECLNFIANASFCLIEAGESQFIDYIHAEEMSKEININEIKMMGLITEFDFALGSPVARQIFVYNMFKDFHIFSDYLTKKIKNILNLSAKRGINIINQIPSSTVRAIRSLMLIKSMERNVDDYVNIDDVFSEISKKIFLRKPLKKEYFIAPLKFWEEDYIKNIFYIMINQLESVINSFFYYLSIKDDKIRLNINSIKDMLLQDSVHEIYIKSVFVAKLINLIIKNYENKNKNITNENKEFENKIFLERLGFQLSRRNEKIEEIKILQLKMRNIMNNDICFNELIDEEIHTIHCKIAKESITLARLEMRLNDTEYPLSVAYRDYITNALQDHEMQ